MKRSGIRLIVPIVLLAALFGFSSPNAVHAAGVCLTGTSLDVTSTGKITVKAGDTVTASIVMNQSNDFVAVVIVTDFGPITGAGNYGAAAATIQMPFATHVWATFIDYSFAPPWPTFTWTLSINGGCSTNGMGGPLFHDGRLNNRDGAESAAVYCDKGNVIVYYIGSPWQVVLTVSIAEIDRVPSLPDTNTLIKQNKKVGVALYRLTSGELQINAPGDSKGPYTFIFTDCARDH